MIDLDQIERINNAGDRYGHITPGVVAELIAEVRRLRADAERYQMLCAASYQMAGVANAPVRFLDALSDGASGELEARAKTDDLLPVTEEEAGYSPWWATHEAQAYMLDAERYRWAISLEDNVEQLYAAVVSCGPDMPGSINIEIDAHRDKGQPWCKPSNPAPASSVDLASS